MKGFLLDIGKTFRDLEKDLQTYKRSVVPREPCRKCRIAGCTAVWSLCLWKRWPGYCTKVSASPPPPPQYGRVQVEMSDMEGVEQK